MRSRRSQRATPKRRPSRRQRRATRHTVRSNAVSRAFGAHLRKLRVSAGLRQSDLIGPGLGRSGVARLEAGASSPSLATLGHLAWVLDLPITDVVPPTL